MDNEKIKNIISNMTDFNWDNDYYDKDGKEKLVKSFKDILFEDDIVLRKFIKKLFASIKELANEFNLIGGDTESTDDVESEKVDGDAEEIVKDKEVEEPVAKIEKPIIKSDEKKESCSFTRQESIGIKMANYLIN